jgi:hypothetical protein
MALTGLGCGLCEGGWIVSLWVVAGLGIVRWWASEGVLLKAMGVVWG